LATLFLTLPMKKITLLFTFFISSLTFSQEQSATFSISPSNFGVNDEITITVSGVDPTIWNAGQPNNIYLWAWYFNSCGEFVSGPVNGNGDWDNSEDYLQLTNNGNGTYSYVLTPSVFFANSDISEIGILVKAEDGTGDKKSQDDLSYVGDGIVINISNPSGNTIILNSGDNLDIDATISTLGSTDIGSFIVFLNEVQVASGNGFPLFSTTLTNLTTSGTIRVQGTPNGSSENGSCSIELIISPTVVEETIPVGMVEGINYNDLDETKATLVLNAPLKDFVYIAGSFNNYNPGNSYLMKKDPSTGKFWLEISGLTSGQIETYQYWVYALNPVVNSPQLVKTADPYSTLVLSPFDDPSIPASTYPSLPTYPAGQEREVTVLQTGQTPYSWVVPNFIKPKKEDLVIYQVLIRDFDQDRNYQDLIDRIDYFKNLNVNAIQLLPNMEFEGNESWGYNPAFHMALDKFYGTEDKFKEFVDLCHQNGIAVILDLVLNQAFGRNPMVRMWMDDPDGDGWGSPSSESPYFNQVATHSYSVGEDFNHQQPRTQNYVNRVLKHWIEEFKIDGFRWDLTKGFTQNCSPSDEGCTNSYQQDRVDILKQYADYSWSLDTDHYVIFEHLGGDPEEQEWANYRIGEGKGIMMWGKMTDQYNQLTMGYNSGNDISRMGHLSRGFTGKRLLGYPESHDEERLMYKNLQFGNNDGGGYDVKNLNTALSRMSALGAVSLTIPGPKMIWHFADLGMENSIFTCNNGSVNNPDCKLDTKPQPQWTNNWLADANRNQIYNDWSRLIFLKTTEAVFEGDYSITTNTLTPKIYIWDNALPNLKNVVILANFDVTSQNVIPNFPYTGTWYDLMDNTGSTSINVTNVTTPINIPAGEFRIYGNQGVTLGIKDLASDLDLVIYPNPVNSTFSINKNVSDIKIFDITGKLVKAFKGDFVKGNPFDISNLSQSLYILKITNNSGQQQATKLVKL
jgi:1,4-alpha-glucan branching enzyme